MCCFTRLYLNYEIVDTRLFRIVIVINHFNIPHSVKICVDLCEVLRYHGTEREPVFCCIYEIECSCHAVYSV
ncbi:hypothetical protein PBCV1_a082R [Paramecium bursaria Chlorella virus 1]|uniref:Uncharacterized protein n=1 Tax=Paramecium bursaria Chlorella virus 1 TaxID=10506 RepID=Q89417_PBCV1|nr:hypothetical protein PBCV1_a082R [Paramecium bursaria Chlorella virus 1]AAC96450.1 hypothetical protein [Paramecium bursaria Chlorella virus 1]